MPRPRTVLSVIASCALVGIVALAQPARATSTQTIALHNNVAEEGSDCPEGFTGWHFVLAPNNGTFAFASISLDLGSEVVTPGWTENGGQEDNVYVALPAGHELGDLKVSADSFATVTPAEPAVTQFNLSHVCSGDSETTTTEGGETTSTEATTTTTSSPDSSTTSTSSSSTSTTAASSTTTTSHGFVILTTATNPTTTVAITLIPPVTITEQGRLPDQLPHTGFPIVPLTLGALILVGLGSVILAVRKRAVS